jgi:hypothetical protein
VDGWTMTMAQAFRQEGNLNFIFWKGLQGAKPTWINSIEMLVESKLKLLTWQVMAYPNNIQYERQKRGLIWIQ